jgi:hypothetical protein
MDDKATRMARGIASAFEPEFSPRWLTLSDCIANTLRPHLEALEEISLACADTADHLAKRHLFVGNAGVEIAALALRQAVVVADEALEGSEK